MSELLAVSGSIVVVILGICGIFKVFGWLVSNIHPDEWDDEDRNNGKHGWWGD